MSRPVVRQAVTIWYLQEWRRDAADMFQLKCAHSSPPLPRRVCISSFASPRDCCQSETLLITSQSTVVRGNIAYDCTRVDTIIRGAHQSWGKTLHCYFTGQHERALATLAIVVSGIVSSCPQLWNLFQGFGFR